MLGLTLVGQRVGFFAHRKNPIQAARHSKLRLQVVKDQRQASRREQQEGGRY